MAKTYKVGVYLRISKIDHDEKNSIAGQRAITEQYAKEHNYEIVKEYVDNGYSGILNSRPALDEMMIDIIRKKINMVIVKDTSRLTRDKNFISYFTDVFFPDNDIRFISVSEYIDTGDRYEIDDMVALRGIINQSYLEDISKKIKAVKTEFKMEGKYIESSVAYGYKKSKENKYQLIIDEETALIVKEIYYSYLDGKMPYEIAKELNSRKVKTPSQYLNLKKQSKYWTNKIINRILSNPIYSGRIPINKLQSNFKLKKIEVTSRDKLIFAENCHEPIIPKEDYDLVQEKRASRVKNERKKYIYLLRDLVYCQNCGYKLTYKNENPLAINSKGIISGKKNENGRFLCEEHNRHIEVCNETNIKISEKNLNSIVLNKVSERLKEIHIEKYGTDIEKKQLKMNSTMMEIKRTKDEIAKLEKVFKTLYTKKVEGIISSTEFNEKYSEYQSKTHDLKNKLKELENKEKGKNDNSSNLLDKLIKDFSNTKDFDNSIMKKLVEKIEVGKNNEIDIFLKV